MDSNAVDYLNNLDIFSEEGCETIAKFLEIEARRRVNYRSLARRLLMNELLPSGALPMYDRPSNDPVFVKSKRKDPPDMISEGDSVIPPTFEIAAYPSLNPTIKNKWKNGTIFERVINKVEESIIRTENGCLLDLFFAASRCNSGGSFDGKIEDITLTDIDKLFEIASADEDPMAYMVVPSKFTAFVFKILRENRSQFDEASTRQILTTGIYGCYKGANLVVINTGSSYICDDIFLVKHSDLLGAFPVRSELYCLPAFDSKITSRKPGWIFAEDIGMWVNSSAVYCLRTSNHLDNYEKQLNRILIER